MTKKNLQMLYDDLRLENETLKQYIKLRDGQQAIDRILMEIAIKKTNIVLESNDKRSVRGT